MAEERGYWNRAGRRSGGNRPLPPVAVPINCLGCGTETYFGLMPTSMIEGTETKSCPNCRGILFFRLRDGKWTTAAELKKALDGCTECSGQRPSSEEL